MKFLWSLAIKNLKRNLLRSSVSIAAIAIAVIAVIFAQGYIGGMIDSMYIPHIHFNSGHIKIVDQDYEKKERLLSLNHPVDGFEGEGAHKMISGLEQITGVEEVIPRLRFGAVVPSEDKLIGMMGWGVNPEHELKFTNLKQYIVEGRMVREGTREVVVGEKLLKKQNLKVGDSLTVLYNTSFGSFKGSTFKIVGSIRSGIKLLDEKVFYLPLELAQEILEMPDQVTELLLVTSNRNMAKEIFPAVQKYFKTYDVDGKYLVKPWYKYTLIEMFIVAEKIYYLIYVLLVVLGGFVVINTMIMIVKERTREIGMMTALGFESQDILKLFLLEGTVMGIIGSIIGAIVGGIGTGVLAKIGVDYSAAMEGLGEDLLFIPVIYPVVSLPTIFFALILGIIVTALVCIIPARRAARLEPTEALRSF